MSEKNIIYSGIVLLIWVMMSILYNLRYGELSIYWFIDSDPGEQYFSVTEVPIAWLLSWWDQKRIDELIYDFRTKNKEYYTEDYSFDDSIRSRMSLNKDIHKKLLTDLVSTDSFVSILEEKIHPLLLSNKVYTLQENDVNDLSLVYLYALDLCYTGKVEQCWSLFVDLLQFIQTQKYNNSIKMNYLESKVVESIEYLYTEDSVLYWSIIEKIRENVIYVPLNIYYPKKDNKYSKSLYSSLDAYLQHIKNKWINVSLFKLLVRSYLYDDQLKFEFWQDYYMPTILHKDYETMSFFKFYTQNMKREAELFEKRELEFYRLIYKVKYSIC